MPSAASPAEPRPSPTEPSTAAGSRLYTPRVVVTGALVLALTAPGQTAGLSILIDPLIAELGISRSAVSTAYMIGTLSGALAIPAVGALLDRYGPRRVLATIALAFGCVLIVVTAISNIVGLTAAFIGLRLVGQGALPLVATTAVALYVERRRGLMQGLTAAFGAAGISLTPVLLESIAADHGFRTVWLLEGLVILTVALPLALVGLPKRTLRSLEANTSDGRNQPGGVVTAPGDWTVWQATRTRFFWVVTAAVAAVAMLATSVNFHQIALLGERGLSPTEAAANFLPQTVAGLTATVVTGMLADRLSPRLIVIGCMTALACAMVAGGFVHPGWTAIGFGLLLGIAGNGLRVLEATVFPNIFGLSHVGTIRGVVLSTSVAASALGPVALAIGQDLAGSYRPVLLVLAIVPLAVCVAAAFTKPPVRRTIAEHAHVSVSRGS